MLHVKVLNTFLFFDSFFPSDIGQADQDGSEQEQSKWFSDGCGDLSKNINRCWVDIYDKDNAYSSKW